MIIGGQDGNAYMSSEGQDGSAYIRREDQYGIAYMSTGGTWPLTSWQLLAILVALV